MDQLAEAIEYINEGDISKGLVILNDLKKRKTNKESLFELAQVFAHFGFIDDAKEIAERLLLDSPEETTFRIFLSECLMELNYEDEAIDQLQQIDQHDDHYLQAQLLMADIYQSQGLEEVAEQKLLEAADHNSNEPILMYALAEFYLAQGSSYKAIPYYERCIENPGDEIPIEELHLHYAEALSLNGEFEKALTYYEEASFQSLAIDQLFKYGVTAFEAKEWHKAIKAFEELQVQDEQYSTLYPYLAQAYEKIGALDEAIETVEKGLTIDEQNEELYFRASILAQKAGKMKDAETYLHEIFRINPASQKASHAYISLLKRENRYEEVVEHISTMTSFGEYDPIYEWDLAEGYNFLEEYDKARQHFEEAYPYFKNDSLFLEQYGRFLLDEGEKDKALILFKKAINIDREQSHLHELIMELEDHNHL